MTRWLLLLIFLLNTFTALTQRRVDSLITRSASLQPGATDYVSSCFAVADEYMDIEQYDSAQFWLNKIHSTLPVKAVSKNNYFLITRQAEVYYYNNLHQLGVQESKKGLAMAVALNDSFLLTDSYNFLGLFYMNIDSLAEAIPYYTQGLRYAHQPPFPPEYISLSKPHHLHGNLAECYFKLKQYDSSRIHYYLSLGKAREIQWQRGIAVAAEGLGEVYYAARQYDSAFHYFTIGKETAMGSDDVDVALICFSGLAQCFEADAKNSEAIRQLDSGFALYNRLPNINRYYALTFFNTAIGIYKRLGNSQKMVEAYDLKSKIEMATVNGNNRQLEAILAGGIENEKRLLNFEVTDARQKQNLANTRLLMALAGLALVAILFFVYRYYQIQKQAVFRIRQKISQDLHDDIGASLSSIQIYSTVAEQTFEKDPVKSMEMLRKINGQSKEIMEDMSDIIWSMKTTASDENGIEVKIKNFSANLMSDSPMLFTCQVAPGIDAFLRSATARRNILLIAKEAIHNLVKYSQATEANLQLHTEGQQLILKVSDNGKGFDSATAKKGNGLINMQHRTSELGGQMELSSAADKGTQLSFRFPLTSLH